MNSGIATAIYSSCGSRTAGSNPAPSANYQALCLYRNCLIFIDLGCPQTGP